MKKSKAKFKVGDEFTDVSTPVLAEETELEVLLMQTYDGLLNWNEH